MNPTEEIRQDANLLEYPTFIVDYQGNHESKGRQIFQIQGKNGASFRLVSPADQRLPSAKDKVVLYFFLRELKRNGFQGNTVVCTRYQVSQAIWGQVGKARYNRIEQALDRFTGLTASFHGSFFEDGKYSDGKFNFIDNWGIRKEDGKLEVKFNDVFLEQMKKTNFYRTVNFEEIRQFRTGLAVRLYEYLRKSKLPLKIGVARLGEKLALDQKYPYPSVILPKVEKALEEITRLTDLSLTLKYNKETRVCIFHPVIKQVGDDTFEMEAQLDPVLELDLLPPEELDRLRKQAKERLGHFLLQDPARQERVIRETMANILREIE